MTRKRRRLLVLAVCGLGLGSAATLTLTAFRDTLVFFVAPSDLAARPPDPGRTVRLGGLVEAGTVMHTTFGGKPGASFRVTDGAAAVDVT